MKLNVLERINLLGILPKEGNFVTLKIIKDLKSNLSFTEEEIKEFNIVTNENNVTWNIKGQEEKEISIGEKATDVIVEALKKLDETKKLTEQYYSLYEKFCEMKLSK